MPIQSEEFIHIVLDQEPERPWLWFCLGLINFRGKEDLLAAYRDFNKFLAAVDTNTFKTQIDVCNRWLGEIDEAITRPRGSDSEEGL